jgi:biopolymer transport protein ExbB/TolQ
MDFNTAVMYGFGTLAILMSALFIMQTYNEHTSAVEKLRENKRRLDEARDRAKKVLKKAKTASIKLKKKAGVREAERMFSKATTKMLTATIKVRKKKRGKRK